LILSSLVTGDAVFPRRLILKGPTSTELAERFDEVRAWIAELRRQRHIRIEMREVRHRILGSNCVPEEAWVDTLDDALALIGKVRDAARFKQLVAATSESQPACLPWLAKYPLNALELAEVWPRLLDVVGWVQIHPRSGVYLRQIDLPGVHSKFIETHRAALADLLDLSLPAEAVDREATGAGQFCRRFGFQDKPVRVRFRMLDPLLNLLPGDGDQDLTLNHDSFSGLELHPERVFITENEINFLAFPRLPGSLVIFGAGYGFDRLAQAHWLQRCRIHYWGDIDTHGFAILDQLRGYLPQVESLLMDRETLLAHRDHWAIEPKPERRDLPHLTPDEGALYDDLRDNRFGVALRLEQERIGFGWLERALATD
jgi:hypothetical protein